MAAEGAAAHDLTTTVGPFMDRHLLLPLLDFLASKSLFPKEELNRSKLEILLKTNMVDFAVDVHKELHNGAAAPAAMTARRAEVVATMGSIKEEVAPILALVQDQGRVQELKAERCFTQAYLQQQLNITPQHVEILHRYAKFVFECGDYRQAADLLVNFRLLTCAAAGGPHAPPWGPARARRAAARRRRPRRRRTAAGGFAAASPSAARPAAPSARRAATPRAPPPPPPPPPCAQDGL